MKEESNHLIEYYTVLKQAGMMIFGQSAVDLNRPSIGGAPEDELLSGNKNKFSDGSEGSDDYLFTDRSDGSK
jgi:hypothetical protein